MNPEAVRDKVSVVGVGCCQFGENWDKSREDMMVDAVWEAYEDAGIEDPMKLLSEDALFYWGKPLKWDDTAQGTIPHHTIL